MAYVRLILLSVFLLATFGTTSNDRSSYINRVKNTDILKWSERLNIAVDAAHELIFRIGLSENMHAKCADFGLSRAFDNNADSHISTRPAGTFGYADPDKQTFIKLKQSHYKGCDKFG
ncbi:hypothetical protein P8452_59657 [Trifolium repens]|nr:hypothetical protein P8452_59657 [Trifolium repens]